VSAPCDIASLRRAYDRDETTPTEAIDRLLDRIARDSTEGIWIFRRDAEELRAEARSLERRPREKRGALYGIPFGIKDTIDVAGAPTTAACPNYVYVPAKTAPVVERLRAEGAIWVGKTNLDQFATGLVGVRSPYGVPPNPFDARYVTGGSSSGSAAAVARGHVPFCLATDTAGSGRIPATFNNLVGLKPSRGLLSTTGLVPACRSIDCITVLALTCRDALDVARIATAFDADNPYSAPQADRFTWAMGSVGRDVLLGIPRDVDLESVDDEQRAQFEAACARFRSRGWKLIPVDMTPFFEAGSLLYDGPWVAERLAYFQDFVRNHAEGILPVTRGILAGGGEVRATGAFLAQHRLASLARRVEPLWRRITSLVVPGATTFPRIEEVAADPLRINTRLGRFTTFGNLLNLAGVSVPTGFRPDGLPAGVTFLGPWGRDAMLLSLAADVHARSGTTLGALGLPLPPALDDARPPLPPGSLALAVVGAHLTGQPLNHQLVERGGILLSTTRTAPHYRLYALPNTDPPKPGLVRVSDGAGAAIEVETWALPLDAVGSFLAGVRAPLCLGTIALADGSCVHGFLCESSAVTGARDISDRGSWRAYLADVSTR
jgi:allophanate hydrolase